MRVSILFATAVAVSAWAFDTYASDSDSDSNGENNDVEYVSPCGWAVNQFDYSFTPIETPRDPYRNSSSAPRELAPRMAHLLGEYFNYEGGQCHEPRVTHLIPFERTPELKNGSVLGLETTVSNYTMMIDLFITASINGYYNFTFRAADAGIVQLGSMTGECKGPYKEFINPELLFNSYDSRWSASRRVKLEGWRSYPIRITVTNMFYASGMYLVVRDPNGKIVRFGYNFSNEDDEKSTIWPEEAAATSTAEPAKPTPYL